MKTFTCKGNDCRLSEEKRRIEIMQFIFFIFSYDYYHHHYYYNEKSLESRSRAGLKWEDLIMETKPLKVKRPWNEKWKMLRKKNRINFVLHTSYAMSTRLKCCLVSTTKNVIYTQHMHHDGSYNLNTYFDDLCAEPKQNLEHNHMDKG